MRITPIERKNLYLLNKSKEPLYYKKRNKSDKVSDQSFRSSFDQLVKKST